MTNGRVRVPRATGLPGDGSDGRRVRRAKRPAGLGKNPRPTGTGGQGRAGTGGGSGGRVGFGRITGGFRHFPAFSGRFRRVFFFERIGFIPIKTLENV